ncbi:MAG: 4Fe-4S binding protein [Clostridiales Family XIII bacterium]|nr:4Fe-4S binding protein [Clostridiales Family XIII bacterium]
MAILKIGGMIMRSLFRRPATLMYPVVKRDWQERTRGHIEIDVESCIFCGICAKKCPTDALAVSRDEKSWTIQRMQCIQCSCCVEVCPKKCLMNEPDYTIPDVIKIVDRFQKSEGDGTEGGAGGKADGKSESGAAGEAAGAAAGGEKLVCDDSCVFCGICAKKCPQDALTVSRAKKNKETGETEGENAWSVDMAACVSCAICVDACPKTSLRFE